MDPVENVEDDKEGSGNMDYDQYEGSFSAAADHLVWYRPVEAYKLTAEDGLWCCDWNPRIPSVSAQQINRSVVASCGGKGLSIWNEHASGPSLEEYSLSLEIDFKGCYMSCAWHPSGQMIAAGTMYEPSVTIWNNKDGITWTEHCKVKIEGAEGSVPSLSWNENKVVCCTTDGYIYIIDVQHDEWQVLVRHHEERGAPLNFVKWHHTGSEYFFCGGTSAIMVYRISKNTDGLWKAKCVAEKTHNFGIGGMCSRLDDPANVDFCMFMYSGELTSFKFCATKDYKGEEYIQLDIVETYGSSGYETKDTKLQNVVYTAADWLKDGVSKDGGSGCIALAREDRKIDLYFAGGMLRLFGVDDTYIRRLEFSAHEAYITCIKWRPGDVNILLSTSLDKTLKVWKWVHCSNILAQIEQADDLLAQTEDLLRNLAMRRHDVGSSSQLFNA